jgi:SAM-dependent methyltransferase
VKQPEVREHWERLAKSHGIALAATTKTSTIKRLEVAALERALRAAGLTEGAVLEAGCGNGWNCTALSERIPGVRFTGFDYVSAMVENARELAAGNDRVRFEIGDLLDLAANTALDGPWDGIFTDRCLINLLDPARQARAIEELARRVKPGGTLILLENFAASHARLNELRVLGGLPERPPAEHNRFFGDDLLEPGRFDGLELVEVDDFGALHDLVLYVLVPMLESGEVVYEHPLVEAATTLSLRGAVEKLGLGATGQNRLLRFSRTG